MDRKKFIIRILVCILFIGDSILCYFLGGVISRGEMVTEFVLTSDVGVGQPIAGKFTKMEVPAAYAVNKGNLVVDGKELKTAVATYNLYKNQPITKGSVRIEDSKLKRNLQVAVPITVIGAVGNDVKPGDIVAIRVKYKEDKQDDTIVSSIPIKDVRTSNGGPMHSKDASDSNVLPGILLFNMTADEASDVNAASKKGAIYVAKYDNLGQPRLKQTFSQSNAPIDDSQSSSSEDNKHTEDNKTEGQNKETSKN